jgi:peptide chain release factor 2
VIDAREKARTLQMTGTNAYGWWRHEEGVHRLVRISPFDAAGKRHTSFCSVSVFPDPASSSSADHIPQSATLDEKDLKIETFRASGAGGQHVNKTDSAVRITHVPTGLVVACQNDRSQHRNKASALAVLQARLDRMQRDSAVAAKQEHVAQLGDNAFGNQIRSYVLAPYRQVKDVRTGVTIGDPDRLLDGDPALFEKFLFAAMQNQCTGIDA